MQPRLQNNDNAFTQEYSPMIFIPSTAFNAMSRLPFKAHSNRVRRAHLLGHDEHLPLHRFRPHKAVKRHSCWAYYCVLASCDKQHFTMPDVTLQDDTRHRNRIYPCCQSAICVRTKIPFYIQFPKYNSGLDSVLMRDVSKLPR